RHHLSADGERVHSQVGIRGMPAFAVNRDFESIAVRHDRPFPVADETWRIGGTDMGAENSIDTVEAAVPDHEFGTARYDLFGELMDEHDGSRQFLPMFA